MSPLRSDKRESSLHLALKALYTNEGDKQEALVDGYLIDVLHGHLLIEIQTRNFSSLKPKLLALIDKHPLRLVHPIAQVKWIVKLPAQGDQPLYRRKSPRQGRMEHLFLELVRIPNLLAHPNFSLEILLTHEEEIRRSDGKGSWWRRGDSIVDRHLLDVVDSRVFSNPDDLRIFLPPGLPQPFTNQQLAFHLGTPRSLATKMSYCLRALGILELTGKQGHTYLYKTALTSTIQAEPT
jgi:hypothetical protein